MRVLSGADRQIKIKYNPIEQSNSIFAFLVCAYEFVIFVTVTGKVVFLTFSKMTDTFWLSYECIL